MFQGVDSESLEWGACGRLLGVYPYMDRLDFHLHGPI
jgi:hypothetical protein